MNALRKSGLAIAMLFCALAFGMIASMAFAQESVKIGVSFGSLQRERWLREWKMMEAYAKELGNVELVVLGADNDAMRQVAQAEEMLGQGIQALLVVAQDAEVAAAIVESAHQVNVPVIAYDRMILNADVDAYVSFNSIKVGEYMAEYLLKKYPKGNYVILKGSKTDNNANLVYQGQMNVLKPAIEKGDVTVAFEEWCANWSPIEAAKYAEQALQLTDKNVQAILTSSDGLAEAAVETLGQYDLAGKVGVSGQDADVTACQRIVEGTQTMTIYKPLASLSKAGIDTAIALIKGQQPTFNGALNNKFKDVPAVMPEIYPVDASNIVDVVIKSGFHPVEEVYKNLPKEQWPN